MRIAVFGGVQVAVIVTLLSFTLTVSALEKTMIVDVEQVWTGSASQAGNVSGRLELNGALGTNTALTSIIRARAFGSNGLYPNHPEQSTMSAASKRLYVGSAFQLELRELYIDFSFENANLRLGKQQVVWGQADGLKLLDVVNPQDFSRFILDEFDQSRIPIWMVNFELFLPIGDLQLLWIPDASVHNLASRDTTYEFNAPFANIPADVAYSVEDAEHPDNLIQDGDIGTRLLIFKGGWDLTFNYLYHYDDFPVMRRALTNNGLIFSPDYERTHTLGFTASNAFGDFILRSEFGYNSDKYISTNTLFDNPVSNNRGGHDGVQSSRELGYVVGLDWTGLTDTFISIQLFQSILLDDGDYVRDRTDTNVSLLVRRYFLNESLKIELLGIHHQNDGDRLVRLSADYELTSNTTLGFFSDSFDGESNELYGQFDDKDRIGFKVTLGF
ncbi:MAG: hypothetical protein ACI82A_004309 [Candidatus Azotimanducaceae bacterium]|jgi:hypothetical protein